LQPLTTQTNEFVRGLKKKYKKLLVELKRLYIFAAPLPTEVMEKKKKFFELMKKKKKSSLRDLTGLIRAKVNIL
jgi:hypothetical protein